MYTISEQGLECPAYLWNVDRIVYLTPIQVKWQSLWASLKCYDIKFDKIENETDQEFQDRGKEVTQAVYRNTKLPPDPMTQAALEEWLGTKRATVTSKISADLVEHDKNAQSMIGNIFVDILRHLHGEGEVALANSLWHSVRVDAVGKMARLDFDHSLADSKDLPDEVGDLLSDAEVLRSPWQILQLDLDRHGSYHQVWLIDRIMQNGFLWTGNYIASFDDKSDEKGKGKPVPLPRTPGQDVSSRAEWIGGNGQGGILNKQLTKQILASMFRTQIDGEDNEGAVNLGALVTFCYVVKSGLWDEEGEARRRQRVSAFDVDGPCLVATPFDSTVERLPHPEERSMSVCWVVEPIDREEVKQPKEIEEDRMSELEQSDVLEERGREHRHITHANLEQTQSHLSENTMRNSEVVFDDTTTDENLSGKEHADEQGASEQSAASGNASSLPASGDSEAATTHRPGAEGLLQPGRYRVLTKVKGFWELMDDPRHQYVFV
jgi:hypothetical protein